MDAPFDRTNVGLREKPSSQDINQAQGQIYRTMQELVRFAFGGRNADASSALKSLDGFLGDGLRVVPSSPAAQSVVVSSGMGFLYTPADLPTNIGAPDLLLVNDLAVLKPGFLMSPVTFAVPTGPSGPNTRIDIIEVAVDRRLENSLTRQQLDVPTKTFLDHSFYKTLAYGYDGQTGIVSDPSPSTAGLSYKIGSAANPGVVPATTSGYVKIAEIRVGSTQATFHGQDIADRRKLMGLGGVVRAGIQWRQRWNSGTPIVDIISVVAPPGVELAVAPDTNGRNEGTIYVIGGEFTKATGGIQSQIAENGGTNAPGVVSGFGNMYGDGAGGGVVTGLVTTVQPSQQAGLTAAGIAAGLTQKLVQVEYEAGVAAVDATVETLSIPSINAVQPATGLVGNTSILIGTSVDNWTYGIELPVGSTILSWQLVLDKATNGGNTVTGEIHQITAGGTDTGIGASLQTSSAVSPGYGLIFGVVGLTIGIAAGFQYYFAFTGGGGITPATDRIGHLVITYTKPPAAAGVVDDLIWSAQFDLAYH